MSNVSFVDIRIRAETNKYIVYETARTKDQRLFAKKQLRSGCSALDTDRFKNEARVLARLDHPNIIRVVDQQLNELPLYVITPLYAQNLRDWLGSRDWHSALPNTDVEDIFSRVLDAIAYAHDQGVIHRDLKPENILLNSAQDVVVIDFNISVSSQSAVERLTPSGHALGTPHYLAPEQLRDASSVDVRTDIFSLGVILFELYGGKVGSSVLDLEPLPSAIRSIVEMCTQADRTKRFPSVRSLASAWRLANDLHTKHSEINELESFMLLSKNVGANHAAAILHLLETYADDDDIIDKFFMEVCEDAVKRLVEIDANRVGRLIDHWTAFFSQHRWPFSYTDDIARRCEMLWTWIPISEIRAELTRGLVLLASRHNRFFVWRVAGRLVERCQGEDVGSLLRRLLVLDKNDLISISSYFTKAKLAPELRGLFSTIADEERTTDLSSEGESRAPRRSTEKLGQEKRMYAPLSVRLRRLAAIRRMINNRD